MTIIPKLLPVESSSVKAVGYLDGQLFIQYTSGSIYVYKNVLVDTFINLINSSSVGHFVATEIKPIYQDYDYLQ